VRIAYGAKKIQKEIEEGIVVHGAILRCRNQQTPPEGTEFS